MSSRLRLLVVTTRPRHGRRPGFLKQRTSVRIVPSISLLATRTSSPKNFASRFPAAGAVEPGSSTPSKWVRLVTYVASSPLGIGASGRGEVRREQPSIKRAFNDAGPVCPDPSCATLPRTWAADLWRSRASGAQEHSGLHPQCLRDSNERVEPEVDAPALNSTHKTNVEPTQPGEVVLPKTSAHAGHTSSRMVELVYGHLNDVAFINAVKRLPPHHDKRINETASPLAQKL